MLAELAGCGTSGGRKVPCQTVDAACVAELAALALARFAQKVVSVGGLSWFARHVTRVTAVCGDGVSELSLGSLQWHDNVGHSLGIVLVDHCRPLVILAKRIRCELAKERREILL